MDRAIRDFIAEHGDRFHLRDIRIQRNYDRDNSGRTVIAGTTTADESDHYVSILVDGKRADDLTAFDQDSLTGDGYYTLIYRELLSVKDAGHGFVLSGRVPRILDKGYAHYRKRRVLQGRRGFRNWWGQLPERSFQPGILRREVRKSTALVEGALAGRFDLSLPLTAPQRLLDWEMAVTDGSTPVETLARWEEWHNPTDSCGDFLRRLRRRRSCRCGRTRMSRCWWQISEPKPGAAISRC